MFAVINLVGSLLTGPPKLFLSPNKFIFENVDNSESIFYFPFIEILYRHLSLRSSFLVFYHNYFRSLPSDKIEKAPRPPKHSSYSTVTRTRAVNSESSIFFFNTRPRYRSLQHLQAVSQSAIVSYHNFESLPFDAFACSLTARVLIMMRRYRNE